MRHWAQKTTGHGEGRVSLLAPIFAVYLVVARQSLLCCRKIPLPRHPPSAKLHGIYGRGREGKCGG
jgi:hypothetical protein